MATYFHGNTSSEIESSAEGLQTLYLMNPNYVPYSDAPNMLLVNPNTSIAAAGTSANALNLSNFSHAPPPSSANNHHHHQQQQQNHLVGFTIPSSNILGSTTTNTTTGNSNHLGQHGISGGFQSFAATTTPAVVATNPRAHYNLWGSIINQTMSSVTTAAETTPSNNSAYSAAVTVADDSGYNNRGNQQSGLSLSLSSQQPSFRSLSGGEIGVPVSRSAGNGVILGSKYLKAVQEVLDEAVKVGKEICEGESMEGAPKNNKEKMRANIESETSGIGENSGSNKQGAELSMAQRQELQMKKSKLLSMLDEVELRYRQYHNQMDMVISSFEQGTGYGAAKSYTTLALKTISKQFRCLKDAISSQIKTASKTLGDQDDCLGAKVEGSRLRYVDHHLRQQRALQQLGMIQHNAWRPQRGLPERAVSVLRAWLFEHFLHPYPKDSDKVMLAKQTGLTRSQVSNWFINARVRLWKPMVEEMYLEEIKEQEQNNDNTNRSAKDQSSKELWSASATNATHESSSGALKLDQQINSFHSKPERLINNQNTSPTEISNSDNNSLSTSPMGGGSFQSQYSGFHLAESSSEIQIRSSPKKPRSSEMQQHFPGSMNMEMKPGGEETREANTEFDTERHNKDGYPLKTSGDENHGGGYGGAFSMEDIGRFNVTDQLAPRFHGNGVSLTLGLPHNDNLSLSATQHGFLPQNMHLGGRLEMETNENEFCGINNTTAPPSSHSGTSYENIDIQNRKRFAAQLLRNFVA